MQSISKSLSVFNLEQTVYVHLCDILQSPHLADVAALELSRVRDAVAHFVVHGCAQAFREMFVV